MVFPEPAVVPHPPPPASSHAIFHPCISISEWMLYPELFTGSLRLRPWSHSCSESVLRLLTLLSTQGAWRWERGQAGSSQRPTRGSGRPTASPGLVLLRQPQAGLDMLLSLEQAGFQVENFAWPVGGVIKIQMAPGRKAGPCPWSTVRWRAWCEYSLCLFGFTSQLSARCL